MGLVCSLSVDSYYCFNLLAVVDLFKSFIFGWLNFDRYLSQEWVKVREDPFDSGTYQQNERWAQKNISLNSVVCGKLLLIIKVNK